MAPGQRACEGCGATVLRLFTTTLRLVDLDPEPSEGGTRVIVEGNGGIRVRTLTGVELPALDGNAHRPHECEVPGEVGVKCAAVACPGRLVPLLDAYHPECHPEVTDRLLAEQRARIRAQFRAGRRRRST